MLFNVLISSGIFNNTKLMSVFVQCYFYRSTPRELPLNNKVTVEQLNGGKNYEFRVAAVSEAGPGLYAKIKAIRPALSHSK